MVGSDESVADRYRKVAATFGDLVAGVPADGWSDPAPCAGWTARDVVAHLVEWVPAVLGPSGLEFPGGPTVSDDPVAAWAAFSATIQSALDDPDVSARRFDAGPPGEMTLEAAIGMLVVGDVFLHSWDLARATGQDLELDPELAEEMLVGMQPIEDLLRASGHYGPAVAVAADAGVGDRLIAFVGRDPDWRPPAGDR
jgi:uncharacterized protein (TIGR03086 family)